MPLGKFAALDVFLGRPPKGSFVAHEELHVVQMKKFGHIETENVIVSEEVMANSNVSWVLPTPVGPRNRNDPSGFSIGFKPNCPRSRRKHTRDFDHMKDLVE